MVFKDLKAGYPIYVFDKNEIKVYQGKVSSVGMPHLDPHYNSITDMVVDVAVEYNGNVTTYSLKENTEIGYANNYIISPSKDNIVREVEALKTNSEEILSQVDTHRAIVDRCTLVLSEFNPAIKEKRETEARFQKLESSVGEIKDLILNLSKKLN